MKTPPKPDIPAVPSTTRQLVCVGSCELKSNQLGVEFIVLNEAGELTKRSLAYSKSKQLTRCKPGSVYSADFSELTDSNAVIKLATVTWIRLWENSDDRLKWQEATNALLLRQRILKTEKEMSNQRETLQRLQPLRRLYLASPRLTRLAIEVQVLAYLRDGHLPDGKDGEL